MVYSIPKETGFAGFFRYRTTVKFLNYMSKRKINQRQAERIKAIQNKRLSRAAQQADSFLAESHLGSEQTGLLITRYGKQLQVEAENGDIYQCHSRQNLYDLVVGDKVIWQAGPNNTGVIVACLPRSSLLARTTGKRQEIKQPGADSRAHRR